LRVKYLKMSIIKERKNIRGKFIKKDSIWFIRKMETSWLKPRI